MSDVFSKTKRSFVMSRIKSRGNATTELALVALLRRHGMTGWRRKVNLTGRPDFVFPARRLVVFVDGCFWHGCPRHGTKPKRNAVFWAEKITRNRRRDRAVSRALLGTGWRVLRIWEHELKRPNETRLAARLKKALRRQPVMRGLTARGGGRRG